MRPCPHPQIGPMTGHFNLAVSCKSCGKAWTPEQWKRYEARMRRKGVRYE